MEVVPTPRDKEASAPMNKPSPHTDQSWFEKPANVNRMIIVLAAASLLLLLVELLFGYQFFDEHHPAHFAIENVFGYQAWLGFGAFVIVVFLGTLLRMLIRRPEDYYDR